MQLQQNWQSFFESGHGKKYLTIGTEINKQQYCGLQSIIDLYPDQRSLVINWYDIDRFDSNFSSYLLDNPQLVLDEGKAAIRYKLPPDFTKKHNEININLRVLALPEKTQIPEISEKHLGTLISVEGILRKIVPRYLTLKVGYFKCTRCGTIHRIKQETGLGASQIQQPLECYKAGGGCGRAESSTTFKFLKKDSKFINTEKLELQDLPEGALGAKIERKIGYVFDDLTGILQPGDKVNLIAIVQTISIPKRGRPTIEFKLLLDVIALERLERTYDQIEIRPEDIVQILTAAKNPEVFNNLVNSIAPSVYGQFYPKLAIVHSLFGGVERQMLDGTKKRADIHILMVGDPSTAKTQILIAVSELASRAMYVQGKQVTAAGLTACCVKDEFGEGNWSIDAGAMVLTDRGTLCISDFHNMNPSDRLAMNDALEQQVISIAKAGITAELKSRCGVIADANPKYGRFSEFSSISSQIDLSPPLLSRFDAIFVIFDKPELARDKQIAQHILSGVSDNALTGGKQYEPFFTKDFLQKYISYAKTIIPKLKENGEAFKLLMDFYLQTRNDPRALEEGVVSVTPRQLDGLVRLAFASARIRLSNTVEAEDAERSIQIVRHYLKNFVDDQGIFDIDLIVAGTGHSQRSLIFDLITVIENLQGEGTKNIVNQSDIISGLSDVVPEHIVKTLDRMVTDRILYRPTENKKEYRLV